MNNEECEEDVKMEEVRNRCFPQDLSRDICLASGHTWSKQAIDVKKLRKAVYDMALDQYF